MPRRMLPLLFALIAAAPATAQEPPRTGSFETTFTERSPLSSPKVLPKRVGVAKPGADYDVAKHPFLVYVPPAYDPDKPMGLIVLCNYKPSETLPTPVLGQFDAANVAFATCKDIPDTDWHTMGLALDAADALRKQYRIDPRRMYVFGGVERNPVYAAQRLGMAFPEVFTGTLSVNIAAYKPVKAKNGGVYPAKIPHPEAAAMAKAKEHPFIVAPSDGQDEVQRLFAKSLQSDGFRAVTVTPITVEQFHYPNYTTDWIPAALKFLDDTTAKLKLPATKPAKAK